MISKVSVVGSFFILKFWKFQYKHNLDRDNERKIMTKIFTHEGNIIYYNFIRFNNTNNFRYYDCYNKHLNDIDDLYRFTNHRKPYKPYYIKYVFNRHDDVCGWYDLRNAFLHD